MGKLKKLAVAAIMIVLTAPFVTAGHAETRVALVIGNGAYQNVAHLSNPSNDANLVATALKQDGFGVTLADDLDHDGLIGALRAFGKEADGADWAVIYYAGHGIEMAGVNYMIPVDAKLETDRDVGFEAVPIDQVMSAIEGARSLRMVILDACRNDPFLATMKRSGAGRDIGRGLALVEPEQASLVAFSAKAGTIAADGDGADSPFATALAKHLTEPGIEVNKLFRLVRDDVLDATGRKQEPFVYGSLPGRQDFYFRPPAPIASPLTPPVASAPATSSPAPDEKAWQQIATSSDPIDFESFVRFFPESAHKAEADLKAQLLRMNAEPKVAVLDEPAPSPKRNPPDPHACSGGLVATVGNAGVAAAADRCLRPKDVFRDCENCPEMVVVPAGSFTMGSPTTEEFRNTDEGPQHGVRIGAPFAVGKFAITRGQFAAFVNDTGYKPGDSCFIFANGMWADTAGRSFRDPGFSQDDSHPAACISWHDAKAYAAWLAKTTGKGYRLLSEAEWEYATRAGSTTAYFFGDDSNKLCDFANGADLTLKAELPPEAYLPDFAGCKDGYAYTAPVGSFAANDFGLYDMIGNVWVWVEDCYHNSYDRAPKDGSAWTTGNCRLRVFRGGSWARGPYILRSANRGGNSTDERFSNGGLRVARTLSP